MRTDDGSIIQTCLNGEPEAFGVLVDRYKAGIFAYIYARVTNFQDAQEVTQDVFLAAYQGLSNLKRWERFSSWLFRIAYNHCKKWQRKQIRHPQPETIENMDQKILDNFFVKAYHEEILDQSVHEALNSLPETYREVLMLYYFGDMDSKGIAESLGTSPTAIRMRLSRAREQLKEEMIAMMGTAFENQRLRASFTFRIVEAIKRIKIQPVSQPKSLPWGISLATGLLITILSINPILTLLDHIGTPAYLPLPAESKVLKIGEIPVDVVKTTNTPILSSSIGKGNGGELQNARNALSMAPQGEDGTWARKADMPTGRGDLSSATIDGKIYAIGGGVGLFPGLSLSVVEEYNPVKDTWTKKADMPTARMAQRSVAVNGKIYVIGGAPDNNTVLSTVEEYDPMTNKWTKKADMPTARSCLSTSVVDGKIYAIGGGDTNSTFPTVEEYDPVPDKWKKKSDMPTPRYYHSASVVNGKIYVIGGSFVPQKVLPTVEEYDPAIDKWTRKANMPTARDNLCTCVSGRRIYAIGGWPNCGSIVEEYNPVTDTWIKKAGMPTSRYAFTTSEVNGKIYAIGGNGPDNPNCISTMEEYTPDDWQPGQAVFLQGKLPKTWGKLKNPRNPE